LIFSREDQTRHRPITYIAEMRESDGLRQQKIPKDRREHLRAYPFYHSPEKKGRTNCAVWI